MKKVLILYNRIWPYRIPIFELLNEKYDLTVSYSIDNSFNESVNFKVVKLSGKQYSRFFVHKDSLHEFCKNFDVVVGYGDIGWLSLMRLLFKRKRTYKIILWGIGVRASYNSNYGEKNPWDKIRYFLMRKADAILFYSNNPIKTYLNENFRKEKLHIAENTVMVNRIDTAVQRDNLLFIGTLYRQKQIYSLLESFKLAKKLNDKIPILNIIGDGDEYENIKKWIAENNFEESIYLRGKIFDENQLCKYFSRAIACISPGQAGLSVLKSMGYGVPFITKKDAITGGEIFNIENGINGVLYENNNELENIILDITKNRSKYIEMGKKAKIHYDSFRKPEDMANGIIGAIEYVCK
ncbi:glycosyltransferase [Arenibacter troitsensis]|uniref:Glycosyltransferase involved in cell wall bisynthesis n=1 Tax=Arenibacter troitsensis TaxID=188872 RepID=A0A1X7IYR4_9FLAO|nr:glycosyltransferase [Arenibacter troitsensis]SMG20297.1 Glycosyltransferase involved in cell wall bisynthesis [Arenibacter troitsensis]